LVASHGDATVAKAEALPYLTVTFT
jgi:hypothetical protein